MRAIINISLPQELAKVVDNTVAKGTFATRSEFFRHLLRLWMEMQLKIELDESEKEFLQGKGKVLRSLKDLR